MTRRARVRITWLLGAMGVAMAAACSNSTTPHQPVPCPSYSGGLSQGDSLYGLYQLVSYCLDTLPASGPPNISGHVTLSHAGVDSFVAVIVNQGQPPESILGTYTHPGPDSIHDRRGEGLRHPRDRKSTRLNSSHGYISYAVFCLKKKKPEPRGFSRAPDGRPAGSLCESVHVLW